MADIGKLMLDQFKPPEVAIDCVRCRRHATVTVAALKKKFGNQRLDVIARMVARSSTGGAYSVTCALADDPFQPLCSARPIEVDPVLWANILDAERGGWRAYLHCHRRLENLKRAKSCSEVIELPVLVLKAKHGWDFELEKLPRQYRCRIVVRRPSRSSGSFPRRRRIRLAPARRRRCCSFDQAEPP